MRLAPCAVWRENNNDIKHPTGGGQLDIREASLLHVALSGRVDLHLEHPAPGDHLHGPVHRRDPPRHLPQHHDWQAVRET